ncbi:hypothetical protein KIMCHI1738_35 [Corynebacterium phage Kimchi1738]|uniref:Uncharacterized protein n=1 Tax=Corynebacterium phage Kimchi1738 TaxID=2483719 RepID=A0A3G3LWK4_9CAUD|nr:hypothetical protein KNU16_gp35 [Corynebacterium phage Kimchi1738]AYQ98427.1 hypothetical protein KIMCHI1738_35 [Corynebacterium phage Kimchi1738]
MMSQNLELYRDLHNESLWTPEVVYDVTPQNALVREGYNYGEGADGYNQEDTRGSLLDGVADFFSKLFSGLGNVIGGVVQAGVGVLSHIVSGVTNLIGGIASAIRSIFGGGSGPDAPPPPEPIFNPIKTNLEAALTPHLEKVDSLLEDSAGIGDESKTIQQQMRELIDPDNQQSALWEMQHQINTLNTQRDDLQDQMIELNRKSIGMMTEYISRSVFIPRDTPVDDEYFTISRVSDGNRWRVTAKPGWVGHYVWQSVYYFSSGDASPVLDGRDVGIQRQWDEYAWNRNQSVLTYWVKKGAQGLDDKSVGGYVSDPSAWSIRPELTFTASESVDHDLYYRVAWNATTFEDTYGIRVVKNGTNVLFSLSATKVGPRFPWESGFRNQTISEFRVPLEAGDVVTFESYSNASGSSQRQVSSAERKISWVYDPKE